MEKLEIVHAALGLTEACNNIVPLYRWLPECEHLLDEDYLSDLEFFLGILLDELGEIDHQD